MTTESTLETLTVMAPDVKVHDRVSISQWLVTEVSRKEDTIFLVVWRGRHGTKVISYPADTEIVIQRLVQST